MFVCLTSIEIVIFRQLFFLGCVCVVVVVVVVKATQMLIDFYSRIKGSLSPSVLVEFATFILLTLAVEVVVLAKFGKTYGRIDKRVIINSLSSKYFIFSRGQFYHIFGK